MQDDGCSLLRRRPGCQLFSPEPVQEQRVEPSLMSRLLRSGGDGGGSGDPPALTSCLPRSSGSLPREGPVLGAPRRPAEPWPWPLPGRAGRPGLHPLPGVSRSPALAAILIGSQGPAAAGHWTTRQSVNSIASSRLFKGTRLSFPVLSWPGRGGPNCCSRGKSRRYYFSILPESF